MVHKAERPSHSLHVKGIVGGKHLQLLVDRGAVISLMSRNCTMELGITIHPDKDHRLMGANEIHLMVVGSTEPTPLQIGDETFILKFVVVEELVATAILGSDFLMNNKITLDFRAMILKTVNCNTNIPLMLQMVSNDTILLHVEEDTYISNQQEVRCQAQLHHKDSRRLAKDGHYLYKPNEFLWGIASEEEIPLTLV